MINLTQVYRIDADGFFLEPVLLRDEEDTPYDCVNFAFPEGMYRPRFVEGVWVEDMTADEIKVFKAAHKPPPSQVDVLGQQLVEKDIQIMDLQAKERSLGEQIVAMDIRLMMGGL